MCYSLWYNSPRLPADIIPVNCTTSCNIESSTPEDGRNHRSKHDELIGIINKQLLLHLVGCLYYFTSGFKYIQNERLYQKVLVRDIEKRKEILHDYTYQVSWNRSVSIATKLWTGWSRNRGSVLGMGKRHAYLHQSIRTG